MFGRVVLVALLATTLASAQRGGGGGGGRGRGGGGDMGDMGMMRPQRKSRIEQFADKLKLSQEQRGEVEKIFREVLEKSAPVRAQIDTSRANLAGAMIQGQSADEIKKMTEAHAALEAQMDLIEADAFSKIYAMLKPNQQPKAGQAFELMAGYFDRFGGGGGGGGGRGARGGR